MNILYLHGWASEFNPESDKIVSLGKIGKVYGKTIDYCRSFDEVRDEIKRFVIAHEIDMIVGTSLGGYWASVMGSLLGIPFVSCNPSLNPAISMVSYEGEGTTYTGKSYNLTRDIIDTYSGNEFSMSGSGLILLDANDDVIDSRNTFEKLRKHYNVITFDGGSHQFEHMEDSLHWIQTHFHLSTIIYN